MSAQLEDRIAQRLESISAYAMAMRGVPGGQFLTRFDDDLTRQLVHFYGAPVVGLTLWAPEIIALKSANVLIGGELADAVVSAGRWYTLYARVLQPDCKLAYVICTHEKQKPKRVSKSVLMQPPQRLVQRSWADYLAEASDFDAVVLGLESFDDLWGGLSSEHLRRAATRCPVLLHFRSEPDAIIARVIARLLRYSVGEPAALPEAQDVLDHKVFPGTWWIRLDADSEQDRKPEAEDKESVRSCFNGFRGFMEATSNAREAEGVASAYGVFTKADAAGEEIQAIQVTPVFCIDTASGRIYRGSGEECRWTGERVPERMMRLLPDSRDGNASAGRYQAMLWLSRALAMEVEEIAPRDAGVSQVAAPTVHVDPDIEVVDVAEASPRQDPVEDTPHKNIADAKQVDRRRQRTLLAREPGVTNVLAIAARLGRPESADPGDFDKAKTSILRWLRGKGFNLEAERASQVIETSKGEVAAEGDGDRFWAIRFDDRAQMASGAFWRVEATLLSNSGAPAIGMRVSQIRQLASAPPPVPGVPTVMARIAAEIGLHDGGYPLKPTPWRVQGAADAEHLLALLTAADRIQPVVVISMARNQDVDGLLGKLAARLVGVAHVVTIDPEAANTMIGRLGRNLSVYGKAIRLYRPGFSEEADPFRQILWTYPGIGIPKRVVDEISEDACAIGLQVENVEERVPSFQYVRNAMSDKRLRSARLRTEAAASSAKEERERQQAVRDELEGQLADYKELVESLRAKYRRAKEDASQAEAERDSAQHLVKQLKYQLNAKQANSSLALPEEGPDAGQVEYPDTWDDLEAWVDVYGNDRIVLLPQALKAARSSPFRDIQFTYRVLEFLAVQYVEMRMRRPDDDGPRDRCEAAKADLGIEVGPVGDAVDDKRYKKEYRKPYQGKTIKLDQHVKRGIGFDGSTLFRLYFAYDSECNKVVVGHFPTHLTNRISHQG